STEANSFTHSTGGTVSHGAGADGSLAAAITFPETPIHFPDGIAFSNGTAAAEESIIDKIRAAKGQGSLNFVVNNTGTESIKFNASTDFGATGLVLTTSNSPAVVIFDGGGRVIDLTGSPSGSPLITVGSGVTLTLKNITFMGLKAAADGKNNNAPVIVVKGGHLVMGNAAVIRDNTAGAAAYNRPSGGGVYVASGMFTMKDGAEIGGNTASATTYNRPSGGGVFMAGGTFTLESGSKISGNTANGGYGNTSTGGDGGLTAGGVYVAGGTFTMKDDGSCISGNTGNGGGNGNGAAAGGVYVTSGGTFAMEGGSAITGNAGTGGGGGWYHGGAPAAGEVYVASAGTFTMKGSSGIRDNTGTGGTGYNAQGHYGGPGGTGAGGVYVASGGTFTITENTVVISGNTGKGGAAGGASAGSGYGGYYKASGGTTSIPSGMQVSAVLPATGSGGVYRKKTGPAGIPV
ncbi:MAG: hypothetical protein LBE17_10765, partial [Treponema sp.]|nr:hypothetical protein [Treponema sp.]